MAVVFVASPESLPHGLQHAEPNYDSLLDAVARFPNDEDIVFVVRTDAAERVVRGLRMSLNTRRIGIYRTTAPPTVFFMVAATLALLPPDRLGLASAVERQVIANSYTQVLMSSVARVSQPNPRLMDHVLSLFPWTRFVLDWTGQQIRREKDFRPVQPPLLVAAHSQQQWKPGKITALPPHAVTLPTQPLSAWESRKWVELSAVFAYPENISAEILSAHAPGSSGACVSCGRLGSGQRCIFCAVPVSSMERALSSEPQPQPEPQPKPQPQPEPQPQPQPEFDGGSL